MYYLNDIIKFFLFYIIYNMPSRQAESLGRLLGRDILTPIPEETRAESSFQWPEPEDQPTGVLTTERYSPDDISQVEERISLIEDNITKNKQDIQGLLHLEDQFTVFSELLEQVNQDIHSLKLKTRLYSSSGGGCEILRKEVKLRRGKSLRREKILIKENTLRKETKLILKNPLIIIIW